MKKNAKTKALSLLLTIAMLLSLCAVNPAASAASNLALSTTIAQDNNTVTLEISITGNETLLGIGVVVEYDKNYFTFTNNASSYIVGNFGADKTMEKDVYGSQSLGRVSVDMYEESCAETLNYTGGTFITLIFAINDITPTKSYDFKVKATAYMDVNWTEATIDNTTATIALDTGKTYVPTSSITLDPSSATLTTKSSPLQLEAMVLPENPTLNGLTWTSSVPSVATVSNTGLVTPNKNSIAGTTIIRATAIDDSNVYGECAVEVRVSVTGVYINPYIMGLPTIKTLNVDDTEELICVIQPSNAYNPNVMWSSSNEAVATVDQSGKVTAVAPGTATITVTTEDGGYSNSVNYGVTAALHTAKAAKIGATEYNTLDDALAALNDGETIVLLKDLNLAGTLIALEKDCSIDLNEHILMAKQIYVPVGVTVDSISNGTLVLTGGDTREIDGAYFSGGLVISGTLTSLSDCNIAGTIVVVQTNTTKPFIKGIVELIDNCNITGVINVYGELIKISGCTVEGYIQATGHKGQGMPMPPYPQQFENGFTGTILGMYDCDVTYTATTASNNGAILTERGEIHIYSGKYTAIGTWSVGYYMTGNVVIYGGKFNGLNDANAVNGSGIRKGAAIIAGGYALEDTPDAQGYYDVIPAPIATGTVTFNVTPNDATLTLRKSGEATDETPTSSVSGTYVFTVVKGVEYTYTVTKTDYTTKTGPVRLDALSAVTVSVTLTETTSPGNNPGGGTVSGGEVINSGGTYNVQSEATGTILVMTREPVVFVGPGIETKISDLTIDCSVSGADVTIRDLWINNNVGRGTPSGEVNFGRNILNFTGKDNTLVIESINLLETQEYVQGAGIHVPKGAELTFTGSGTLYMYKYSQGAGIGGNSYEACGNITFAGCSVFIKGSKTGPLVGGDVMTTGPKNDPVYITDGTLVLINKAQGAAIGSSHSGTCAGDVYLQGGNLTIISDYHGSAIGYGGGKMGTPGNLYVSGGSFKAVRTGNSLYGGLGSSADEFIDDSLVTANKSVSRLIFDTTKLAKSANSFTVSTNKGFSYSGGLHQYKYTESTSSTMANFGSDTSDKNLYFYLPMEKQTLTANGEKFDVDWDSAKQEFTINGASPELGPNAGGGTSLGDDKILSDNPELVVTIEPKAETKDGAATASVAQDAIADAIKEATENEKQGIAIAPTNVDESATSVAVTLPKASVIDIAEADLSLVVNTPLGNLTFDVAAVAAIGSNATGNDVQIIIKDVDTTKLSKEQQEIVGDRPVIDLTVISNGQLITNFGNGKVIVTIPYTLKPDEKAEGLKVFYLAPDGKLSEIECRYNATTKCVEFAVTHFSQYVIAYDAEAVWDNPFTDVKDADWFYNAVKYVSVNGLMKGMSDTTFAPQTHMSRAMLATVLYRIEGEPKVTGSNPFSDVKDDQWYTDAIIWASENGIVTGIDDGKFGTDNDVTREQIATMLYRYAKYKEYDVKATAELTKFTDADVVSEYALEAVKWANSVGLVNGRTDTTIVPQGQATRAEVATMLMRFIEKHG